MYFSHSILICYMSMFSWINSQSDRSNKNLNIEEVFINWNKATLLSLKEHIRLSSKVSEGKMYQNRLLVFKEYLGVESYKKGNIQSIRYKFLDKLFSSTNMKECFYIIEANRSGESVEIINYVARVQDKNVLRVDIYNYNRGRWIKNGNTRKMNLHFNLNLKGFTTRYGLGFNQDPIIVTQFVNNSIKKSEYYLQWTLPKENPIGKILLLN